MKKAYDPTYTVPENFYVDERADTPRSYTFYHVNDSSGSYELCTDDRDQAFNWEAADNASRSVNGEYVGEVENERYFEFIRELSYPDSIGNISDPTSPGFSRVFKCTYANRNGVDRHLRDGYAGTLNLSPIGATAIRIYAEYLWQFTFFWPASKTVLYSFPSERAESYQQTLRLAFVINRGFENCDLIEVIDWIFSVDKTTGEVTKEFRFLYSFEAQLVNGSPQICGN